MAKPYEIIKDYYPSAMFAGKIAEVAEADRNAAPGWRIMNEDPAPGTPALVFDRFVRWANQHCTWSGSDPRGSGHKLLDGGDTTGQCQLFASAFMTLLTAPAPFGLGLQGAQIVTWKGRYNKGFVVAHTARPIQLGPNVQNQQLYLWENHKVVQYGGQLWDAAYGVPRTSEATAIHYHLMPNEVRLGNATWYPAEPTRLAMGAAAMRASTGGRMPGTQGMFFKEQNGVYSGPFPSIG